LSQPIVAENPTMLSHMVRNNFQNRELTTAL
jgi:hypothetical protein